MTSIGCRDSVGKSSANSVEAAKETKLSVNLSRAPACCLLEYKVGQNFDLMKSEFLIFKRGSWGADHSMMNRLL